VVKSLEASTQGTVKISGRTRYTQLRVVKRTAGTKNMVEFGEISALCHEITIRQQMKNKGGVKRYLVNHSEGEWD
jgi:hypothetical protein